MSKESPVTTGMKVGRYLKYQRKKQALSLQEFAQMCSLSPSYLFKLEQGKFASVSFDMLKKISDGLKIPIVSLLRKCELISEEDSLSSLDFFLKEKYQFPEQAILGVKIVIEVLQKQYANEIKNFQKAHKKYWKK